MVGSNKIIKGDWSRFFDLTDFSPAGKAGAQSESPDSTPCRQDVPATPDYADLFDRAPVGYMLLDGKGAIQRINETGAALLGWDAGWLAGKPFARWVVNNDRQLFHTHRERVQGSEVRVCQRVRVKNRQGRTVYLRLESIRENETGNGTMTVCRTVMIDVSDDRESARKQHHLQSQLTHMARLNTAGELASNLAHELNQPLGTVVLNCEAALRLLKSKAGKLSELTEALTHAVEAASFASGIVRNLRGFLRNDQDFHSVCQLSALIQEVSKLIEADARDAGVELRFEIEPHLPSIRVNAVQIEQVLLNLAHNSIEAMREDGGGPHYVLIRAFREASDEITVGVTDSGPGFDAKQRALMFTPLYTTKRSGMGMGLSISRTIVEAHGGRLWAAAEPGGATVFFTLPGIEHERHAH